MKTDQTGRTCHFYWFCHDVAQIMLVVFKKASLAHTFKIYINLHVLSVLIPAASPSVFHFSLLVNTKYGLNRLHIDGMYKLTSFSF